MMAQRQTLALRLWRHAGDRARRQQMRPGFFAQHFKAMVHGAIDSEQRFAGHAVRRHLLFGEQIAARFLIERGKAFKVFRREIFIRERGFIERVVVVAARHPVQRRGLAPLAAENIQEQIGTALATADDRDALTGKRRRAQHHFAGVEAMVVLRRHAVGQINLFTDAHADVTCEETIALGHHFKQPAGLVKTHLLHLLTERQIAQVICRPAEVIGELFTGHRALFGSQETVKLFALYQVVQKTVTVGWLHRADQIFEETGLHMAVRHHHARMPGEVRFAFKEQRAEAVKPFGERGDAEIERADANADEIVRFHDAVSLVTRYSGLSRSVR